MKKRYNLLFLSFLAFSLSSCGINGEPSIESESIDTSVISSQSSESNKIEEIYHMYKANGGTLSYDEWLESIKGEAGKSSYEIYKEHFPNYVGTEEQWLDDLVNGRLGTKVTHSVIFDSDGGSSVSPQTVLHGEKASKPTDPTKKGYAFMGWYDYEDGENWWAFNGFSVTKDLKLVAAWEPRNYTATFVNNDGTELYSTCGRYGREVEYNGETPVYSNPQLRHRYTFLGWDKDLVIPDYDVTFTARYQDEYLSTTLQYKNGEEVLATYYLADGESSHEYEGSTPTKETQVGIKYSFNRWVFDDVNSTETNIIYYAVFDEAPVGMTFNESTVTGYSGTASSITIPETWEGYPINEIAEYAFSNCTFENIIIRSNITNIGRNAFEYCSNLSSITIPQSVDTVGNTLFLGCSSLTEVYYNTSAFPANGSLFHNEALTRVVFNGTNVPDNACYSCTNLTEIILGDNVKSLGSYCFYNCTGVSEVVLPTGLTYAGFYSFYGSGITKIVLHEGITSVDCSFRGCNNLEYVIIPKSLTIIEGQAFYLCPSTMKTFYMGNQVEWNVISISSDSEVINTNVYFYSVNEPTSAGNYWHYIDNVPTIW